MTPKNELERELFGSGKSRSEVWWKEFAKLLCNVGLLVEVKSTFSKFGCTVKLSDPAVKWLNSDSKVSVSIFQIIFLA